jgi:hypothetical protein
MAEQAKAFLIAPLARFAVRLEAEKEFQKALLEGKTMGQALRAARAVYGKAISELEDEKP